MSNFPITKTIDKALEKPASTGGRIINGILLSVFSPLIKYEVKKEAEIEAYKQKILNEINKIPEEKQTDPPLNIVGPAIEASKFYIDSDYCKSMFAKLIASSMNTESKDSAHSSFVEIIKQLSSLDAQNLKTFINAKSLPIAKFRFESIDGTGVTYKTNVFLSNSKCKDIDLIAQSLSNLTRLGLIEIDYLNALIDDSYYDSFKNHKEYIKYKDLLKSEDFKKMLAILPDNLDIEFAKYNNINIKKGIVYLTPFGESFIETCI